MVTISKEAFISAIESIREQTYTDFINGEKIQSVFRGTDFFMYDNSLLEITIIKLLQVHFPKKDDFCEIEHYCYAMNFGKVGENALITVEDLWNILQCQRKELADSIITKECERIERERKFNQRR
jgi:hypothetical protein